MFRSTHPKILPLEPRTFATISNLGRIHMPTLHTTQFPVQVPLWSASHIALWQWFYPSQDEVFCLSVFSKDDERSDKLMTGSLKRQVTTLEAASIRSYSSRPLEGLCFYKNRVTLAKLGGSNNRQGDCSPVNAHCHAPRIPTYSWETFKCPKKAIPSQNCRILEHWCG